MPPTLVATSERFKVFHFDGEVKSLAPLGLVDAYVVSTEEGFSPLGSNLEFLANDLQISAQDIRRLANWNRFDNPNVSLVAIRSRNPDGVLKGIILAACETAKCYERFGHTHYKRKPSRDFFYNVSYEAFAYASRQWGATRLCISHLSGSGRFHQDIATCAAEAFAHLAEDARPPAESLTFLKDTEIMPEHMVGVQSLLSSEKRPMLGSHTPAFTATETLRDGHTVVHISIPRGRAKLTRVA